MKHIHKRYAVIFGGLAMVILILDSRTALEGCREGIALCMQTVIPSVFPFLILSGILVDGLQEKGIRSDKHLPLWGFILGSVGGYPTGARCVDGWVATGRLTKEKGKRLLAYCSNAGPAFLFGIGIQILPSIGLCWIVWCIHILSAILVRLCIPHLHSARDKSYVQAISHSAGIMKQAVTHMATICGWVTVIRMLLMFLQRWVFCLMPQWVVVLCSGVLELANGCVLLPEIGSVGSRLVCFAVMLSFGGICVWLQTISVVKHTDTNWYLPGKITQAAISVLLCIPAQYLLPVQQRFYIAWPIAGLCACICGLWSIFCRKPKIRLAFSESTVYNEANST